MQQSLCLTRYLQTLLSYIIFPGWSIFVQQMMLITMEASGSQHTKFKKRKFVFLNSSDPLKNPARTVQRTVEKRGQCKELEFHNNDSTTAIQELVKRSFRDHLDPSEASRQH